MFVLSTVNTLQPLIAYRGVFSIISGSVHIHSAPATMANPDTGSSGEQSALTTQNIMEGCLPTYPAVWMIGRLAAHLDACLLCLSGCFDGLEDSMLCCWLCKVYVSIKEE